MKKLMFILGFLGLFIMNAYSQQEVVNGFDDLKPHDVLIYPNPMTGEQFTVKSTLAISKVEVVNVIGKVIKRVENEDFALKEVPVVTGTLKRGLYLVKVSFSDDKLVIKKLLVK